MDNVFKFYLKSPSGNYYRVVNGSVMQASEKTELKHSVSDWKEAQIGFLRSSFYWGAFREYTAPVTFVLDGAKILRSIFYTQEIAGKCILYVEKLNRTTYQYAKWFEGDIDFSKSNDSKDYFKVSVTEKSPFGLIKNREDVEYEIDLSDPEAITGQLDGVKLGSSAGWVLGDSVSGDPGVFPITHATQFNDGEANAGQVFMTTQIGNNVQAGSFIVPRNAEFGSYATNIHSVTFPTSETSMKTTAQWYGVDITGYMVLGVKLVDITTPIQSYSYKIECYASYPSLLSPRNNVKIGETGPIASTTGPDFVYPNMHLSGTIFTIEPNRAVTFYLRFVRLSLFPNGSTIHAQVQHFSSESFLSIKYQAKVSPSVYKGFRYVDLFKKLVERITGTPGLAESTFLANPNTASSFRTPNYDNSPYNTIVTSGDGLRSVPEAKIKTTFKNLFSDAWSTWGLALTNEGGMLRLEPLKDCLSDTVIMHLKNVGSVTITPYSDKLFNQVKVGYGSYDNDNVEGKNEFNVGVDFLLESVESIAAVDEIVSPFRADVYGIESVRAETYEESRQDNRGDNSVFLIEVAPTPVSGVYLPYRPSGATISGVDDPTNIYNIPLSPGRKLRRHLARIRSVATSGFLKFQSTDRNPELVSNLGAGTITETADIDLTAVTGDNGQPVARLFKPFVLEVETSPPYSLAEVLELQTKGCISFNYKGETFKGFILDVTCQPGTNEKHTFSLLSHPDNDLTKLI